MSYATFETSFGTCAIAWNDRGIRRIQLPEADSARTVARLLREGGPDAQEPPPAWVARAIAKLVRHLEGEPQDLRDVRLDLEPVARFRRRVYEVAREVAPSRTVTYGELAVLAGSPKATRAVGQAMARNPFPIVVPCHRVLAASGAGGFSAHGGCATKGRLLALEGVRLDTRGGLPFDAREAVRAVAASDEALARVIERVGPLRLKLDPMQSVFDALAEAIVYQQLTGKAAATIARRLREALGALTPEAVHRAPDETLRGAGLSRAKAAALRDLARRTDDGTVPELEELGRLAEDAIVERLTRVRGVGRWTVEMLLVFRLGRPDVLPSTDYGIRKGFARTFRKRELPTPREVEARGERWRPWRTVASWYLWRSLELEGKGT